MKKSRYIIYLVLLYTIVSVVAFGQSRTSLGINTKVGYTLSDLKKASNLVISYGILSEFRLSDNKFLRTEINFVSYGINITDIACLKCGSCYCPTYKESQFNSIAITLSFRMEFKQTDNANYYFSAGISPYLIRWEKIKLIEPSPEIWEVYVPEVNKWKGWTFDIHNLFLNITPGINFRLGQKFRLHTEIFFQYDILYVNNHLAIVGLDMSLFYQNVKQNINVK